MAPSRFPIRNEMSRIVEAPGKTWFWELAAAVIDAERCIQCGACVAVCPSDSIGVGDNDLPVLVKMCTGCSLCWDFCPRGGLRYEAGWPAPQPAEPVVAVPDDPDDPDATILPPDEWRIVGGRGEGLGPVRRSYTARVVTPLPHVQDGGVVSALLVAALETGLIDGAIVARPSVTEPWKGVPFVARNAAEVLECGGSFYNQTMGLAQLDLKGYDLGSEPRLAVIGTPCEIQGLRAMQDNPWWHGSHRVDAVVLAIALLCTKSFDYQGLMLRELRDNRGLDLAEVERVDVIHGKLIVEDRNGTELVREPIKNFHGAALKGCDECADFLGRGADISVGSVGSPDGWSSVLVRTGTGARVFGLAQPSLEVTDLARPEALEKLDAYDRKVALDSLRRDFDPDGPLFWSYQDHVDAYDGTDRAPVYRSS